MGWDSLTCIHGITEGVDSHSCKACQDIARDVFNFEVTPGKTWIFTKEYLKDNKEEAEKIREYEKNKAQNIRKR